MILATCQVKQAATWLSTVLASRRRVAVENLRDDRCTFTRVSFAVVHSEELINGNKNIWNFDTLLTLFAKSIRILLFIILANKKNRKLDSVTLEIRFEHLGK